MKILLCTVPYPPSIGGIETVSALLAQRFSAWGHEVRVLTTTPAAGIADDTPWRVLREPSAAQLFDCVRWADVVLHNNISLRMAWPLLLLRRPWVVAHHTWIVQAGRGALAGRVKRLAVRAAHNLAVSRTIASALPVAATIVANPYDDAVFRRRPELPRTEDLIFVGRLVSDKGLDVLLEALALLRRRDGAVRRLTVVGDGPQAASMRDLAARMGLADHVHFARSQRPQAVAELLNRHRIIVVPSVWEEPFGIVALEAMACGCVPIVARSGALPEVVDRHGLVVPKGDAAALAAAIEQLGDAEQREALSLGSEALLARHRADAVAGRYLDAVAHAALVQGDVARA